MTQFCSYIYVLIYSPFALMFRYVGFITPSPAASGLCSKVCLSYLWILVTIPRAIYARQTKAISYVELFVALNAIQTMDNEISHRIIYCLNCIRCDQNSTHETGLSRNISDVARTFKCGGGCVETIMIAKDSKLGIAV